MSDNGEFTSSKSDYKGASQARRRSEFLHGAGGHSGASFLLLGGVCLVPLSVTWGGAQGEAPIESCLLSSPLSLLLLQSHV